MYEIGLIVLIICFGILVGKSADLVEDCFTYLAHKIKVSPFIIGFSIIGFTASLPELFIAVNSAREGNPELSIGNILGGYLFLLLLLLGVAAIKINGIKLRQSFQVSDFALVASTVAVSMVIILDGIISYTDGLVIIVLYSMTVFHLFFRNGTKVPTEIVTKMLSRKIIFLLLKAMFGMIGLVLFSSYLVDNALELASLLQVSPVIIGITLVTLGTNLPELLIILKSKSINSEKLAVGTILGSILTHALVLGILALMSNAASVKIEPLAVGLVSLAVGLCLLLYFVFQDKQISRREGKIMILVYTIILLVQIFIGYF